MEDQKTLEVPEEKQKFLCPECGRECKNAASRGSHRRFAHKVIGTARIPRVGDLGSSPPPEASRGEGVRPSSVTFRSPMSAALRIVVAPSYWTEVVTPAGNKRVVVPGKTAEFQNGLFKTADPEIIDYLENKYKDDRYPIFSDSKLREMGKGL